MNGASQIRFIQVLLLVPKKKLQLVVYPERKRSKMNSEK